MGKGTRDSRDDFSTAVKLDLAKRVNFRCSVCDAHTSGPQANSAKSFTIGKAAHIKAAAAGGPRYDPTQTSEERRSIDNGLWACANCADIIDRDADAYSVEKLLLLKSEAERRARKRVGRVPTAHSPVLSTPSTIQQAVADFCRSEAARHEQLDPRFSVSVEWSMDGPVYVMSAREPVPTRLSFVGDARHLHSATLRDVLEYGGSHAFENIDIRMEGSPLFPDAEVVCKRLQISTQARPVLMTVALGSDPDASVFVEFPGEASQGEKGLRFTGTAFGGLLTATLTADHRERNVSFTFHFELQQWAGKPLLRLPHFARLKQVIQGLTKGMPVKLHLAMNGVEAELAAGIIDASLYIHGLRAFLYEVEFLRKLDGFFALNLTMPLDLDDVLQDQADGDQLLAVIDVHNAEKPEIRATLIPTEPVSGLAGVIERQDAAPIELRQQVNLRVFGHTYGPFEVEVACPHAVIQSIGPANLIAGQPVQLLLKATDGHHWTARYLATA